MDRNALLTELLDMQCYETDVPLLIETWIESLIWEKEKWMPFGIGKFEWDEQDLQIKFKSPNGSVYTKDHDMRHMGFRVISKERLRLVYLIED